MTSLKAFFIRVARNAKKKGIPLERVLPDREPFISIVTDEYNRYQPRR